MHYEELKIVITLTYALLTMLYSQNLFTLLVNFIIEKLSLII